MKTKLLLLLALLAATGAWRVLAFDANEDGMSDVYASHYGLSQDSAAEDEDGDGFTNLEESKWGTDPTQMTPPFISIEPYSSNVFVFRYDSVLGKKYMIEFTDELSASTSWTGLGNVQSGNGNTIAFGTQVIGDRGFWRLAYKGNVDFDGDGLSLYEENLLGTQDNKTDTDGDYILDVNEYLAGTQPNVVDTPPAVTFEPAPGDYSTAQTVELQNLALPDYIYYTTDGSEPTLFSAKYTPSATIDTGSDALLTIRAKVILPDGSESAESSGTYRVGVYASAPQTVYYGWVTANGEMGYAYDTADLAQFTYNHTYAPKEYLTMGSGWIVNGIFEPEKDSTSQPVYYGMTLTPTNGATQPIEGYSTDASAFYDGRSSINFFNYRPVGNGWIDNFDNFTPDIEGSASKMIYFTSLTFTSGSTSYPRHIYNTYPYDQLGYGTYAHTIAKGWVLSIDEMLPDTSIPSSMVRYGPIGSNPSVSPAKRITTNHANDIGSVYFVPYNSIRLGYGWAKGDGGMIPDRSLSPQTLYYGEKPYTGSYVSERVYTPYETDIIPSSAPLYPYRRLIPVGPGYSLNGDSYELAWASMPQDVFKGTENIYPASLAHETNFLSYDTSKLQSTPVPTLEGNGWIENNEFIEYIDDNDGLDLADEIAAGTNPNYFDTDGDLIPDGFEVNSIHLDPLVANPLRGEDFDGDGLDTYLELINGSDPDLFDSDGDTVGDGEEVDYGTDPFDDTSKPFDPYDFVGPTINDPNCEPIGDLGVFTNGGSSSGYSVAGTVGDPSSSESERWRLLFGRNSGNRKAESQEFGVVDEFELNLHAGTIFEITLEHVATNLGDAPDYDYEATLTDIEGFLLSDPDSLLGTGSDVDIATVEGYKAYLAPIKSVSFSESFSGGDAVGPRYRKVALNGRPMPDEKPEQESETEEYAEESYVDAFDLSLHHDTSYIYTPLASSDLVLQVTASARETGWSDRGGLKPHEQLTMPFGASWSSNLCAYVEAVETYGDVQTDPITINVVDESGRSQRFGTTDMLTFFPWPSSRVDKKTWLNKLEGYDTDTDGVVDRLIYTKKYGTQLTYDLCDAWFMYSTDRVEGSNEVKKHRYWRLTEVIDRYGNDLVYDYGTSDVALIPQVIQSNSHPNQFIAIDRSDNCRRVESITDSRGNTISFNYQDVQVFDTTLTQLTSVDYPDGTSKEYTYETVLDIQNDDGRITNHFHSNIKQIKDKAGNAHTFHYSFDRSKSYYASGSGSVEFAVNINYLPQGVEDDLTQQLATINEEAPPGTAEYKQMYGVPRLVTQVDLPDSVGSATFAKTAGTETVYGPNFSATSGTTVTDALGNVTAYTFSGIDGEIVDVDDSGDSLSTEWMIYYTQMEVHHGAIEGEQGHLGKETFVYDLASGLSLASMTDFSGNTTSWTFDEDVPTGLELPELTGAANFMTKWADPTSKTDALNRVENYQYGNYRIMSEINDVHGTVTSFTIDSMGRRKSKTVTDAGGTKLLEETYIFADEDVDPLNDDFPGFMVEKRVVAYQNLSGEAWEQDLVTKYVPDTRGRLWKEIVDPDGLALTTEFNYDLNNNRTSVTDPRNNETVYTYDKLNRLVQITYPVAGTDYVDATGLPIEAAATKRLLYNERGNLVCEVDENGHYTFHFYDALGRKTKTVRDMDGVGLPTLPLIADPQIIELDPATHITAADIVTEKAYNAVNSLDSTTDPRGTVTKHFYDDLQRVTHTYTHFETGDANADGTENGTAVADSSEKTHTEFIYEIAQNTGASGFSTEGFKPTQIISHDAVRGAEGTSGLWTLNSHFTYDADYRETQSRIEYTPGNFNQTDTAYGTITSGKETLVSTVTDALNRDTTNYRDGLGRTTKVVFPDLTESETRYTSTGLAYESEDELNRLTNTEFDAAGRAVLVKAPAVYNALSGTYERPETETIYDAASNVIQTINPLDEVWEFEFDARNRKVKETQPAVAYVTEAGSYVSTPVSPEIENFFDGAGNVIATTDPRGNTTRTFHDRSNRPTYSFTPSVDYWDGSASQNAHLVTHTIYDDNSNPLQIWQGYAASVDTAAVVIDRLKVANTYDKLNRLSATSQDVDGDSDTGTITAAISGSKDITVTNEHDDAGNRVAVEDGESQRTEFFFDGLGRNTAVHYGVTAAFSATSWIDGKRTVFDALRQTHRLMGTTPGNDTLSSFVPDADSHVTAYGYDSRDRLITVDYADDATIDRQYTLDAVGNVLAVDEIDGSTIGTETIADVAYVWDALDRQRAEYSAGDWHVYEYDLAGNRIYTHYSVTDAALTNPQDQADGSPVAETALLSASSVVAGRSLNSDYDALNRLETVTEGSRVSGYRYDLAGNIREKSQPNGDVIKRTFDALGRKAVITGPGTSGNELYVYTHTFDLFGNLSRIAETYPAGQLTARTVTNTYDGADRLVIEAVTGTNAATTTYGYDRANNRTLRTIDDGTPETWRYVMVSGLNRLDYAWVDANADEAWTTGEARRDYSYNNLGVMTAIIGSDGDATDQDFEYDYENRLLDVADGAATKDYAYGYDYRTRRSLRDESAAGGTSTSVSFSGGTSAREYAGGASTPTVEYVRGSDYGGGIGGILYTLRSGTPSFKHYNSRGDVVAATDGTGTLTYQAAYEAFARHGDTPSSEEWGSTADRQQGNTKDEDGWGALNEGFRYRLLDEGVFMVPDPLGYADGVNHYTYVVQNPWTYFDPLGLSGVPWHQKALGWSSIESNSLGFRVNDQGQPQAKTRQYDHNFFTGGVRNDSGYQWRNAEGTSWETYFEKNPDTGNYKVASQEKARSQFFNAVAQEVGSHSRSVENTAKASIFVSTFAVPGAAVGSKGLSWLDDGVNFLSKMAPTAKSSASTLSSFEGASIANSAFALNTAMKVQSVSQSAAAWTISTSVRLEIIESSFSFADGLLNGNAPNPMVPSVTDLSPHNIFDPGNSFTNGFGALGAGLNAATNSFFDEPEPEKEDDLQ